MKRCIIIVENLPVPFDRRVWQEARALNAAGWAVSVICPRNKAYPLAEETIDGIEIHRHPLPLEARGALGFVAEYATALFHQTRLLWRIHRTGGFDVVQACNPPDLMFLVAAPYKLLGKRFVFDHHDIAPELFEAKFNRKGPFHALLRLAEWLTFKCADAVISANDTFRQIAIERGGVAPAAVTAVYSVPDRSRLVRVEPAPDARKGRRHVLGYIGIIGDQDGVDQLVHAVHDLKTRLGQDDFHTIVVGDGPALESVKALAHKLGVDEDMTFTGYLSGQALLAHLSAFDIGVIPDPVNPYNDKISMNKVFEYSALGIPSVAYRLGETMRLLGDAGTYAERPDSIGLAEACQTLMNDDPLRASLGARAKQLADVAFLWEREANKYVAVFESLLPAPETVSIERRI